MKKKNICDGVRFQLQKYIYTETLEVNLFAFAYRLSHKDFSPIYETS